VDIKTTLKATVAAGALLALVTPVDAVAGGKVSAANSKVDITIGGRLHRSLVYIDDGQHSELFQTAGITGNSEMWLAGEGKLTESVSMGGYLRWDITKQDATPGFGSTTGADAVAAAEETGTNKYEYVYWKHNSMGTLTMGAIEPAGDGTMDGDYASGVANGASAYAGAAHFTSGTAGAFVGPVGNYFGKIDPGGPLVAIRYDSPAFSGFSVHGSYHQDGGGGAGIKYAGKVGGLDFFARVGYNNNSAGAAQTGASAGVSHSSGFHVSGNFGKQHNDDPTSTATGVEAGVTDPTWWRVIGGYNASFNSLGSTNFVVSYEKTEDDTAKGNEGKVIRAEVMQNLDAVGARLALGYANLSASDTASTDFNDIDVVFFETNFNF